MDVEKIRELRLAYPFEPFELVMDDGRRFFVDKPYYLGIAPDGSHLGYSLEGNAIARFTANQVVDAVRCPTEAPTKSGNGNSRASDGS